MLRFNADKCLQKIEEMRGEHDKLLQIWIKAKQAKDENEQAYWDKMANLQDEMVFLSRVVTGKIMFDELNAKALKNYKEIFNVH